MEVDLEGEVVIIRLNLGEDVGKEVARRLDVGVTPTFVVFSASGRERHRQSGLPDINRLKHEALVSAS